ncbi:FHA domain-containing protein [Planctomycetota bacterium]
MVAADPVVVIASAPPFLLVGSDASCDVVIDSPAIPPRAFCVCLESENRLWGAMLIRQSSKSKTGFRRIDTEKGIKIGGFRIAFSVVANMCKGTDARDEDHRRCILKWRTGDETHVRRIRPNRPIMLGRELPSQLLVDHHSVSTTHCGLVFDGTKLWVVDAGSKNRVRTVDGAADILQLNDRDLFAAGRVQFKTAIPTDLVPRTELEKLRAEFVKTELESDELEQNRRDLEQRRRELNHWIDDLRAEQDAWLRRRDSVNKEIEERLRKLEGREEAVAESLLEWERFQTVRTRELEQQQELLDARRLELDELSSNWDTTQAAADRHWQSVAEEVKRHKLMIREQQAQLQRENELSVVQRIRMQRELKEREQHLNDREKELIRREIQIDAAQRRLPRDVSNPTSELSLPSDSIADSTVLAANDFVDILDKAIDRGNSDS